MLLKTTLWKEKWWPLRPEVHGSFLSLSLSCTLVLICCTESHFLWLFPHFLSSHFLFSCPISPYRPLTSDHGSGDGWKRLSLRLLHLLIAAPEVVKIMAQYWCSPEQGHEVMVYSVSSSWYYRQCIILALHLCWEKAHRCVCLCGSLLSNGAAGWQGGGFFCVQLGDAGQFPLPHCGGLTGDPFDMTLRTLWEITRHHDKTQMQLVAGWQSTTLECRYWHMLVG